MELAEVLTALKDLLTPTNKLDKSKYINLNKIFLINTINN